MCGLAFAFHETSVPAWLPVLLLTGMAKSASATLAGGKIIDQLQLCLHHRYQYQLGDTFARFNGESAVATVPAGYHQLSLDRKSTRLNSSHVRISYAVF